MREKTKMELKETLEELKKNADKVDSVKGGYDLTFMEYVALMDEDTEELVRIAYDTGFKRGIEYHKAKAQVSNYEC